MFVGEVQLLGWKETHNAGAQIALQLADPSELEPFKTMTVRKGKVAGQVLALLAVEVEDGEALEAALARAAATLGERAQTCARVVDEPKGGPLAQLAGRWCHDEEFSDWLRDVYAGAWTLAVSRVGLNARTADVAAEVIRSMCGIASRAELDHNAGAAAIFDREFREPYHEHWRNSRAAG